jgi:hypothetical protein
MHFEILADDPAGIAEFYTKVLGWTTASWQGQTYWLVTTGPGDAPGINGGIMGRHFAQRVINTIGVESLAEAVARVEEAGGSKIHGPSEIPGVGTHVYCADPEGTMFGLLQSVAGKG